MGGLGFGVNSGIHDGEIWVLPRDDESDEENDGMATNSRWRRRREEKKMKQRGKTQKGRKKEGRMLVTLRGACDPAATTPSLGLREAMQKDTRRIEFHCS